MPRKKKEKQIVKYLIPEGYYEILNDNILKSNFYKLKVIWLQKFCHLFDYIASQNADKGNLDDNSYVNIHKEIMANILAVNNQQMARMLRDCLGEKLLRTDGKMKPAVKAIRQKKVFYVEEGKSFGYQFYKKANFEEIELQDQRCFSKKVIEKRKRQAMADEKLRVYMAVLNDIRIDEEKATEILEEIIVNRKISKKHREDYEEFIRSKEKEYHSTTNNTNNIKRHTIIPFDGVIVPKKGAGFDRNEGFSDKSCRPCKFKLHNFKRIKKQEAVFEESDESLKARCLNAISRINAGQMVPRRPRENSRVYCYITNLKRELRKAVVLDGKKVAAIDIRNSQPLIACILIRQYWLDTIGCLPADVIAYQEACENGRFYDDFMTKIGVKDEFRPYFKEDFFQKVFFSMVVEKGNLLKDMFIEKYPNVWKMICDEKGGLYSRTYGEFATKLQKAEATIIFDKVNFALIRKGIRAFNIFDSIYISSKRDYDTAKVLLEEVFKEHGINPLFNFEMAEHLEVDSTERVHSALP